MSAIEDRVEIAELAGRFADAANLHEYDRFAALFTEDGVWEVPDLGVRFEGRAAIREGIEQMLGMWSFFVQTTHPGRIELDGDRATGHAYVNEIARPADGDSGHLNYSLYDDEYRRTPEGWRFTRRTYHFLYLSEAPLSGNGRPLPDLPR